MGDRFTDRVVVVTGGARGIGEAVMRAFLDEGARGVVLDPGDPADPLPRTRYLHTDVSSREQVTDAFASIEALEGRVDILVNNAGIQRVALTEKQDPAVWDLVVGIHLGGTFNCSALALPIMKRQLSGSIVSIASAAGIVALPGRGPYAAAKAAIMGLTRVMAVEVAELGIRVNAVAPGVTLTPLVEQGLRDGSLTPEWILSQVPMRRFGKPDEIAKAVLFLASDDASYITGQSLVVDGGWTIQGISARPDWLAPTD